LLSAPYGLVQVKRNAYVPSEFMTFRVAQSGNDMIKSTPVPEPTTMLLLLGLGLVGLGVRKFKK
jgi:hypothetical protein